ncbi:MAG: hypothetical protein WBA25_14600 [Jannaschia sp.]
MLSRIKPTRTVLAVSLFMALTPAVFTAAPLLEGRLFPVTKDTMVVGQDVMRDGTRFDVKFRKVRNCTFLGLAWYAGRTQLPFDFGPPDLTREPTATLSRAVGLQRAGPWRIYGQARIEDLRAFALHRCHPFWITTTRFY